MTHQSLCVLNWLNFQLQYNENPEDFNSEVDSFAKLRNTACVYINSSTGQALDNAKQYYCQLQFFKNRFQILESPLMKKGPFDFPWADVIEDPLNPFAMSMHADLESEMAIVFYNIGILHSNLGNKEDRLSSESMKTACNHYQHAAGIFHSLPDIFKLTKNLDFNADSLAVMSYIALAQAQECILEKSMLDNRKANSIVKVGATVVDFYKQSWKKIQNSNDELHEVCSRDWVKYLSKFTNFKMCYYNAIANFFAGVAAEEDSKWGESVAYLARAEKSLSYSIDTVKSNSILNKVVTQATLQFAMDVIVGKSQIAKRENEFIYHDKVPDGESLPELKGQALVKGFPFDVTGVSTKDIFHRLIPLEAHAASSLYSEEKAKILRDLSSKIDAKDEELTTFMLSMNLEQVPNAGDHIALPQELIESAAGLSGVHDNPVKKLSEKMAKLAGISADVQAGLDEVKEALDHDASVKDKQEKSWTEELKKYQEIHQVASESNSKLHQAIQVHVDNLKILSKPLDELQKHIPSMADLDQEAEASIAEFQRIVKKVDEMKTQRVKLLDELRDEILSDDITKKLVIHKENEMPKLFQTELGKHATKIKFLEQNLKAQANIIQAMTEVNAKYVPTRRKVADLIQARKDKISSLVETFEAYESLHEKVSKAVEFYEKLAKNVGDLQTKVQKSAEEKKREAEAALAKMTKGIQSKYQLIWIR